MDQLVQHLTREILQEDQVGLHLEQGQQDLQEHVDLVVVVERLK
jgi:hypothetical protein